MENKLKKCSDHDCECPDIADKWNCWMYRPENGYCPYIQSNKSMNKQKEGVLVNE